MPYPIGSTEIKFSDDFKYLVITHGDVVEKKSVPEEGDGFLYVQVVNSQYEFPRSIDMTVPALLDSPHTAGNFRFNAGTGIGLGDLRDCRTTPLCETNNCQLEKRCYYLASRGVGFNHAEGKLNVQFDDERAADETPIHFNFKCYLYPPNDWSIC